MAVNNFFIKNNIQCGKRQAGLVIVLPVFSMRAMAVSAQTCIIDA